MSKPVAYTIELRCSDRTIGSVRMDVGCSEVIVGRSRQSTLHTSEDDRSVSGKHLRLFWRGKTLFAEDAGSRNGVYFKGVRLTKAQKVSPGDMFSIGNNIVCCEKIECRRGKGEDACHKLERLNGDEAGKLIEIRPKQGENAFTIGLDPGNSLVLSDMLVSRKHAQLEERENGECWIKDLGSRNGTYVNGEVLRGKERWLHDNDTITIAYFDFRFLDRSKRHTRFSLWLKFVVLATTLCVMAGLYVWYISPEKASTYLRVARTHAGNCDFDAADLSLDAARMTRDADKYMADIEDLDSKVKHWRKTWDEWQRTQKFLSEGRLKSAQQLLDPLTSGVLDAWVWNGTTAIEETKNAEFAAKVLRSLYDALDVLDEAGEGQPEQKADVIKEKAAVLASFIEESKTQFESKPYLEKVSSELQDALRKMVAIQGGFTRVDAYIAKLDAMNPDFARLSVQLDEVIKDKSQHGAVRSYADKYKQPCAELAEAKLFIRKEFDDLNAMRFATVRSRAELLKLPNKDLCSRHPQLSDHRVKLERHHADAQKYAENLESMVNGLSAIGVVNGDCSSPLKRTLSVDSWDKAFQFACFEEKPPTTRRKEPSGFYDELLGVDFTFQSLRALPDNYNGWCLRMIGFSPDVVEARKALEYIDVFVKYLDERPAWLRRGELGAFSKYCKGLQGKRDQLLVFLLKYKGDPRAQLIAGFYHGWFSRQFDLHRRKELADKFRDIQRGVSGLCERYAETSDPVVQISIRAKILGIGIPGDAQIHSKWVQKFEGGGR